MPLEFDSVRKLLRERGIEALSAVRPGSELLGLRNSLGETLLHYYVIEEDCDVVRRLLSLGADPNAEDDGGWTPLEQAVSVGNPAITQILLEHGASTSHVNGAGLSVINVAVDANRFDIVQLLLSRGCDINGLAQGDTVLHRMARIGDRSRYMKLVQLGASESVKDSLGETAQEVLQKVERGE